MLATLRSRFHLLPFVNFSLK
uniref:Uncharacterized protein n=1 Tax=Musa acuminata subsp. malaccensis TaxID=214687 RepID=A0A804I690_MUSAM